MIVHTERRGARVGYIERAEYEFRASFDDWGHPVVALFAATDDELVRLKSGRLMFRLRDGLTAEDARKFAAELDAVFVDLQMQRIEGRTAVRTAACGCRSWCRSGGQREVVPQHCDMIIGAI